MSRFVKIARNREPGQRILSRFARQTVDMWTGTSQWHGDTADALNCTVSRTVSSLFHSHNEQNHMTFVRHRHINRPSPLLWRFPVWQQDRRASSGESRRRLGWKRTFTSQSPAIQDWPTARPNMTSRVRDLSGRPGRETAHGAVFALSSATAPQLFESTRPVSLTLQ